jgi:hypothetical protein
MKLTTIFIIVVIFILILAVLYSTSPVIENYTDAKTKYSDAILNQSNSMASSSSVPTVNNNNSVISSNIGSSSYGKNIPNSTPSIPNGSSLPSSIMAGSSIIGSSTDITKYDSNNYNVQYHDNITDLNSQSGVYSTSFPKLDISANDGSSLSLPYLAAQALPTYYRPGSYIYGAATYVPNYEDSVYLSKTTGLTTTSNVYPTAEMLGGYCQQLKNDPIALELKCNSIPGNDCASSQCCVLLGGAKCVSGDEKGPYRKENYSDTTLTNKDYYYYQGKCYGNCV